MDENRTDIMIEEVHCADLDGTIKFFQKNRIVAEIDKDGIFRFAVDPTDENTLAFVECIESVFKCRLMGAEAQ